MSSYKEVEWCKIILFMVP